MPINSTNPAAADGVQQIHKVQEELQAHLDKAKEDWKRYADCRCPEGPAFTSGQKV